MPKLSKHVYKLTKDSYDKIYSEVHKDDLHSSAAILSTLEAMVEQMQKNGDIGPENFESLPTLLAIYAVAKQEETFVENPQLNEFLSGLKTIIDEEELINEKQVDAMFEVINNNVPVNEFVEISFNGDTVINNEEYKQKQAADRAAKKKAKEEKEAREAEQAKKRKEEERAKEQEEKEKGDKFWEEMEKETDVPELGKKKKEEKKIEFTEDFIDGASINDFVKVGVDIYNGDSRSSEYGGKHHFAHKFEGNEIAERVSGEPKPASSVENLIDRVAMYKAEQAKFNKLNGFKRFFSFLFKDAMELKASMNNIAKSFDPKISSKTFKQIAESKSPGTYIKQAIGYGVIDGKSKAAKSMFGPERSDKKSEYLKNIEGVEEKDPKTIKGMLQEEIKHNKEMQKEVDSLGKLIVVDIEGKTAENEKYQKEFDSLDKQIEIENNVLQDDVLE